MKKNLIIVIAIILAATTYLWYFSDRNVVLRKSDKLIECFDKETGAKGLGLSNFQDLLYEKVSISLPDDEYDMTGGLPRDRATLTAVFSAVMRSSSELVIDKQSIELESIGDSKATVLIRFHATVSFDRYRKDSDLLAKVTFIDSEESRNSGWRIKKIAITE